MQMATGHSNNGQISADQISRRELFDRAWSKPMTINATELGTTTSALSTLAKRLGLPLPRAGHWMKKEVGKAPPTPDYPADPRLDEKSYPLSAPAVRRVPKPAPAKVEAPPQPDVAQSKEPDGSPAAEATTAPEVESPAEVAPETEVGEHKKIASTRTAIQKSRSTDRASTGGRGKFRLLVAQASGERACSVLDKLVAAVEAKGWSLDSTEQGYAIVADGETVGLMIEEKLDRVPHVITAAEIKEKAEYDRKAGRPRDRLSAMAGAADPRA